MPSALEVLQFKGALLTTVRPVGSSVAFDKTIQPKDQAAPSLSTVGIKPPAKAMNRGAPTAPMARAAG